MIQILRAKLHGLHVTGADVDYHGSITLDPAHCRLAGIHPLEFVDVWNKSNGSRLRTYVIHGEEGSRCCVLNGAAARLCQPGDEVIICASEYSTPDALYEVDARVVTFKKGTNEVDKVLRYDVSKGLENDFEFQVMDASSNEVHPIQNIPPVDVNSLRRDLAQRGWEPIEIDQFCDSHFM